MSERAGSHLPPTNTSAAAAAANQPPVEPDAWQNLDALSRRIMCPQVEQRFRLYISQTEPIVESEDCLYLNVFVPVDVSVGGREIQDRSDFRMSY